MSNERDLDYGSSEIFYQCFYQPVIFGAGSGAKAVRRTHQSMEDPYIGQKFDMCLEIGSGNGEHLDFVKHEYQSYTLLDLRKPNLESKWSLDSKIQTFEGNAEKLLFPDQHFDRVVSTCLLHHVDNPEAVMNEFNRVLSREGVGTIFLSCDPGLAVRTLRRITVAKRAKKLGFQGYNLMIAREHRNHINSLLEILKFVFRDRQVQIKYYPFLIKSWNLNGYVIVTVGDKKVRN